jgi:AcrR family transcriptional regulator
MTGTATRTATRTEHPHRTDRTDRPGPRERLLDAAEEVTYEHGVTVGVDAILARADVARRSLYQHFGGKDGLLVEVVRRSAGRIEETYRQALAAGGADPRARLLSVFDGVAERVARPGYRGCRFIGANLALPDPAHPVHAETKAHKARVHGMLERELAALGFTDPAFAADQLQLLIDGAMIVAADRPEIHPARAARTMAERLLAQPS